MKSVAAVAHLSVLYCFQLVSYDYGMKGENPVDKVYFYRKSDLDTPTQISQHEVGCVKVIITTGSMSYNLAIRYILIVSGVGKFLYSNLMNKV